MKLAKGDRPKKFTLVAPMLITKSHLAWATGVVAKTEDDKRLEFPSTIYTADNLKELREDIDRQLDGLFGAMRKMEKGETDVRLRGRKKHKDTEGSPVRLVRPDDTERKPGPFF